MSTRQDGAEQRYPARLAKLYFVLALKSLRSPVIVKVSQTVFRGAALLGCPDAFATAQC